MPANNESSYKSVRWVSGAECDAISGDRTRDITRLSQKSRRRCRLDRYKGSSSRISSTTLPSHSPCRSKSRRSRPSRTMARSQEHLACGSGEYLLHAVLEWCQARRRCWRAATVMETEAWRATEEGLDKVMISSCESRTRLATWARHVEAANAATMRGAQRH